MTYLPPEHPDSPASVFAPFQPGMGVVADDVPDDRVGSGRKAADVSAELPEKLEKERAAAEKADAKAARDKQDAGATVVEDGEAKPAKAAEKKGEHHAH